MNNENIKIAYFSAEIGLSSSLPTYSGGLGVLAGDHIKASADAGIEMLGISEIVLIIILIINIKLLI